MIVKTIILEEFWGMKAVGKAIVAIDRSRFDGKPGANADQINHGSFWGYQNAQFVTSEINKL